MPSSKSDNKQKASTEFIDWSFQAIGTHWRLSIYEPVSEAKLEKLKQVFSELVEGFDKNFSRFRGDSWVTAISKSAGSYKLPEHGQKMFTLYEQLYSLTGGLVTPLIGSVLSEAGYDAEYSLKPKTIRSAKKWGDVMEIKNGELLTKQPVLLDFGAAGKGYLVDLLSEILEAEGINSYCLDGSGDMLSRGPQTLDVGLENPNNSSEAVGVVQLNNAALCGSSGSRRTWAGHHHIMNPETASSATDVKAVWVLAKNAMLADGIATALFFVEPKKLNVLDFEFMMINSENKVKHSKGFPVKLFT